MFSVVPKDYHKERGSHRLHGATLLCSYGQPPQCRRGCQHDNHGNDGLHLLTKAPRVLTHPRNESIVRGEFVRCLVLHDFTQVHHGGSHPDANVAQCVWKRTPTSFRNQIRQKERDAETKQTVQCGIFKHFLLRCLICIRFYGYSLGNSIPSCPSTFFLRIHPVRFR